MLKIALLCGGSGGIALQTGFAEVFGYGNYRLDPIINCYDDGKSTGVCRSVFDRQILGPSDLRKNQITQFKLKYKEQLKAKESKESKLLSLFELRFTGKDYLDYYNKAIDIINAIDYLEDDVIKQLLSWINYFFCDNGEVRDIIKNVNFNDFSLSNIFYAACAAIHNNSLEDAGFIMADIFDIEKGKDNELIFRDLLADVLVYPDGFVKVVDLDEFEEALTKGALGIEDVKHALKSLNNLLSIIYASRFDKLTYEIDKRI